MLAKEEILAFYLKQLIMGTHLEFIYKYILYADDLSCNYFSLEGCGYARLSYYITSIYNGLFTDSPAVKNIL